MTKKSRTPTEAVDEEIDQLDKESDEEVDKLDEEALAEPPSNGPLRRRQFDRLVSKLQKIGSEAHENNFDFLLAAVDKEFTDDDIEVWFRARGIGDLLKEHILGVKPEVDNSKDIKALRESPVLSQNVNAIEDQEDNSTEDVPPASDPYKAARNAMLRQYETVGLRTSMLPWNTVGHVLSRKGIRLKNWPHGVEFPGESGRMVSMPTHRVRILVSALEDETNPVIFESVTHEADRKRLLLSKDPIIIGAAPPPNSKDARGRRLFANGEIDEMGPRRMARRIAKPAKRPRLAKRNMKNSSKTAAKSDTEDREDAKLPSKSKLVDELPSRASQSRSRGSGAAQRQGSAVHSARPNVEVFITSKPPCNTIHEPSEFVKRASSKRRIDSSPDSTSHVAKKQRRNTY